MNTIFDNGTHKIESSGALKTTPDAIRKIATRAFMQRFTQAERAAIRKSIDDIVIDIHEDLKALNLNWLIEFYKANQQNAPEETYFNNFFTKLAGTKKLQRQIEVGLSEAEIKASWQIGLTEYRKIREQYLLYK